MKKVKSKISKNRNRILNIRNTQKKGHLRVYSPQHKGLEGKISADKTLIMIKNQNIESTLENPLSNRREQPRN